MWKSEWKAWVAWWLGWPLVTLLALAVAVCFVTSRSNVHDAEQPAHHDAK